MEKNGKIEKVEFQSTLPVWGATGKAVTSFSVACISIHAPRVGSDFFHFVQGIVS